MLKLLTLTNPKATKSIEFGYLTGILHLAPHTMSGHNVCPKATAGCSRACLNYAGHGRFTKTQEARIRRTRLYFENPEAFKAHLVSDIYTMEQLADEQGLKLAIRINGTSDIPKLAIWSAEQFPHIPHYDYTKIKRHIVNKLSFDDLGTTHYPRNLHLTFSHSGENLDDCLEVLDRGGNVSVVFAGGFPAEWHGFPVVDGDKHDLRFLDQKHSVIGLSPKGKLAYTDTSGFVVR